MSRLLASGPAPGPGSADVVVFAAVVGMLNYLHICKVGKKCEQKGEQERKEQRGSRGDSRESRTSSPDNDCANLVQISRVREQQQQQQQQQWKQQGQLMPADMQKRVNE